jgi:hypothetical protein
MSARETFILCQDIAPDQIADFHPKPGSNLRKLVEKKVIDTTFFFDFPVPASVTFVRMDANFLDALHGTGADFGYLTDRRHEVFIATTDNAIIDPYGEEITTRIAITPSLTFSAAMVTGSVQGTTIGNPGDVEIGDYVRIQGQGLVVPYFTQIVNKVPAGPNFILTFANLFVQGLSLTYTIERITRWQINFRDTSDTPFPMSTSSVDFGFFKRVYLADVSETFGTGPINYPEFTPEVGPIVAPSSTLELLLDPGETFLWFHGLDEDIPLMTWWVEWPGYPTVRYFYGMQASTSGPFASHVGAGVPTLEGTFPVDFQHIDENSTLITNRNSVTHRIKAVVLKPL